MKSRWLMLLTSLLALSICFTAIANQANMSIQYDIRVSLDTDANTLVGMQTVTLTNTGTDAIGEVPFALIANWGAEANPYLPAALSDSQYIAGFDPTWTKIASVKTDETGEALSYRFETAQPLFQTFSLANGFLIVELASPLSPGESTTLQINFETKFARALAMDNCVYKDTYVWRFGWNPVAVDPEAFGDTFQLPSADYRVELTIPEDYQAFGGADIQQEIAAASGLKTIELANHHPSRSVPLVLGPDLKSVSAQWQDIDIEAVYLPGGEGYARSALSYAADILAYHSDHFGALTGERVVIAQNPTPGFYGMAADGLVLIGASMIALKDMPALGVYDRFNEYLLAHELAHLWWGIGIGADFDAENWLSEGFAEYLSITYFEDQYGGFDPNLLSHLQPGLVEDVLIELMGNLNLRQQSEMSYLALLQAQLDEAIVQPVAESEYVNGLTIRTYSKGYLVLRALEAIIGESSMHDLLVETHAAWSGQILTVEDFRALAEQLTGKDLAGFFDGWLYGDAQYDVAISSFDTTATDAGYKSTLHLSGTDAIFPIIVEAVLEDDSTVRETFEPGCCSAADPSLETLSPIASIALDPEEMLPDSNRYNNHWPRLLVVTHPFQSEDASDKRFPLDAYVIDISALGITGRFRNDHAWSLTALPHIDPETNWNSNDLLLDLTGVFAATIGRDLGISFTGTLTALDPLTGSGYLNFALTALVLGFSHPQTGMAGQYWYPSWQSAFTIGALGELASPIPYLSLTVMRDDSLSRVMRNAITFQLGIPGFGTKPFGTIQWRVEKRFRLAPLFYVDVSASLAETLFEDMPNEFLFAQDDLVAFDYLPMGHHQQFGRIEVVLPPMVRDSGYAILNLTRLDSITPVAFVQGGQTQANCTTVCEPGIRLEAGAKLMFVFPIFLGSAIEVGIGYVHPIYGVDGSPRLFIDLGDGF